MGILPCSTPSRFLLFILKIPISKLQVVRIFLEIFIFSTWKLLSISEKVLFQIGLLDELENTITLQKKSNSTILRIKSAILLFPISKLVLVRIFLGFWEFGLKKFPFQNSVLWEKFLVIAILKLDTQIISPALFILAVPHFTAPEYQEKKYCLLALFLQTFSRHFNYQILKNV